MWRVGGEQAAFVLGCLTVCLALGSAAGQAPRDGEHATTQPLLMITDYASRGNLQSFLRTARTGGGEECEQQHGGTSATLTARDLTLFALQVATGMEYISSKGLLHRDLAARNVLLHDRLNCVIADFGFPRDIVRSRQCESRATRRLPIRWMAPESLFENKFSTKTDAWAFGVLLWEIVTLGSSPYPGLSGTQVMEMVQSGYRMDKPRHCSVDLYTLMQDCWRQSPNHRPTFQFLRGSLEAILDDINSDPYWRMQIVQMADNMSDILENPPGEKC